LRQVVIMARVLTVNDVLDGHVTLDIECLDRIYLNAYVSILQTSSQVVAFLSGHLGFPFPSPVLFRQLGDRFRKAVVSFSDANDIPEQGARRVGTPRAPPETRPADGARGAVDLRPAPGRAIGSADRTRAERGRGAVCPQPTPPGTRTGAGRASAMAGR
jgi:hypothetical protein